MEKKMTPEEKVKHNPLAFPVTNDVSINTNEHGQSFGANTGMLLRDYFAAKAITSCYMGVNHEDETAKRAYKIADAMLNERAKISE